MGKEIRNFGQTIYPRFRADETRENLSAQKFLRIRFFQFHYWSYRYYDKNSCIFFNLVIISMKFEIWFGWLGSAVIQSKTADFMQFFALKAPLAIIIHNHHLFSTVDNRCWLRNDKFDFDSTQYKRGIVTGAKDCKSLCAIKAFLFLFLHQVD